MSPAPRCRWCNAPIVWAQTNRGRRMPVDPNPTPDGTLILRRSGLLMTVHVDPSVPGPKHLSHFATCPSRKGHR